MSTHTPTRENADAPSITEHVEPPAQGGRRYLRCHGCGREVVGTDPDRLPHAPTCPHHA